MQSTRGVSLSNVFGKSSNCANALNSQVPYSSPISPTLYGPLGAILVTAGLGFLSMSFVQQMNATRADQSVTKDLPLVFTSSALLGFGALFVMLWSGVYV